MSHNRPTKRLDVLTFPLHGARLIEASAGTGKTYTISTLMLRLLLGHGGNAAFPRPMTIDEILVVTFTEAATAELRGRIRARIHEARLAFLSGESGDPIIQALVDASVDIRGDVRRLLQAEQGMDQAAVFTIHGFCQRMLKQHAFESGLPFESEFLTAEYALKLNAVEDCWRERFYPMPQQLVLRVMKLWTDPAQLLKEMSGALAQPQLILKGVPAKLDVQTWFTERCAKIDAFKQRWLQEAESITELLSQASFNGRVYKKNTLPNWLAEVEAFAHSPSVDEQLAKNLYRFSQEELITQTKQGCESPMHSLFGEIDALLEDRLTLKAILLHELLNKVRIRFKALKQQSQLLSFDDLLSHMATALTQPNGELLAQGVYSQYPVAMIDEFQDTDPQQYQIFSRLYLNRRDVGLLLIGDPKQAIYGFRGADIFTYMQARGEVSDHYTLPINWRSTGTMIAATNQLFEWFDNPFIYKDAIVFEPVDASPKHGDSPGLLVDGNAVTPLQLMLADNDETQIRMADYRQWQAQQCATQIQTLLEKARDGKATLGETTPLRAGDIAVLVRTRREGELVARHLSQQQIPCVSLSNRASVFDTPEAYQLYLQLLAVLTPTKERALRAALAAPLLNNSLSYLDSLTDDEQRWQACVDEYQAYQLIWRRQGVLPMLYLWLERREVAARLLARPFGDRILTNVLHLGELLEQQSAQLDGEAALVRWFTQQLLCSDGDVQDQQLRLESDAERVQIVTIHKSKGLEYAVVMVPFALDYREASEALYHDKQMLTLALVDDEGCGLEAAKQERLAEDLRLLYVAVTRAIYVCYLGVGAVCRRLSKRGNTQVHESALGYLLQRAESGDKQTLIGALEGLGEHPAIGWQRCCGDSLAPFDPELVSQVSLHTRRFTRQISRNWWLTSYSALSRHRSSHGFDASMELAWLDRPELTSDSQDETVWDVYHFPRGAEAGTLLHGLFETLDFKATADEVEVGVRELLERASYDANWQDVVTLMRRAVLTTPLHDRVVDGGKDYCLADIPADKRLVEMEFVMPVAGLDATELNYLLKEHDALSKQAQPLDFAQIQGMLKGFIDLVYQHDGRYYILDYKSNHLGDTVDDYSREAMEQAMIEHRYDFQYQLYSLALHRFLEQRIDGYRYDSHFGGVYYLFMRGMPGSGAQADAATGVYFSRPERALIQGLDSLFRGEELCR